MAITPQPPETPHEPGDTPETLPHDRPAAAGSQQSAGARALLATLARGDPEQHLPLGEVFAGLGKRAFGMLLFIATLPAFIPIPGMGGAISGPLTILIGLQLVVGMRRPWLPGFIARRGPHRRTMQRFEQRLAPWLTRLERVARARHAVLLEHRLASSVSGVLLVLLGILLALPIPFTNYLFAVLLLSFAFALVERDGGMMAVAWVAGAVCVLVFGVTSGSLAALVNDWLARLT